VPRTAPQTDAPPLTIESAGDPAEKITVPSFERSKPARRPLPGNLPHCAYHCP
jgi:hypothetical protein